MAATAADESILDTARAERPVWLIKVPKSVDARWQAAGKAGGGSRQVAIMRMSFDPLQQSTKAEPRCSMRLVGGGEEGEGEEFHLAKASTVPPMLLLSNTQQGKVVAEGKVKSKFDMLRPTEDSAFRERMKASDKKYNTPIRTLKTWDAGKVGIGGVSVMAQLKRAPTPVQKSFDTKRIRMERVSLESILFKLFEEQSRWGTRQLVERTNQPQVFVKELLTDLCVFNKRGNYQGTWELKPEYQKKKEGGGGDAEVGK